MIPVVLLLVVVLVFASAVLATGGPPGRTNEDQVREDSVKSVLNSKGKVIDPNRQMASVASSHEGGFGGWYFSDDKDTVYVFMKDTTKTAAARSAFEAAYSGRHAPANTVVVAGSYSLDDLSNWFYQIIEGLNAEGISFRSASIDHSGNIITIGLAEASHRDTARRIMEDLEIPTGAVELTRRGDGRLLDGEALDEEWRPVVGGIQRQQVFDGLKCTIGFGTERNDEEGFILASHCTNEQEDIGDLDNATIHQPNYPWIGSNVISEETIDPQTYEIDNFLCLDNYHCRYSDAAYAELDSGEDLDLGRIAEPEGYNENDVDPAYETLGIVAEQAGFSVGDKVEFIGRTSGWEKAEITSTCAAVVAEDPPLSQSRDDNPLLRASRTLGRV